MNVLILRQEPFFMQDHVASKTGIWFTNVQPRPIHSPLLTVSALHNTTRREKPTPARSSSRRLHALLGQGLPRDWHYHTHAPRGVPDAMESRGCVRVKLYGLLTLGKANKRKKPKQTKNRQQLFERLLNVIKALSWFQQSRSEERRQDCVCAKN